MFKLARAKSQSIPRTKERALAAAQAFVQGALLLIDANGNFAECAADPAAIGAIALTGCGADSSIGSHFGAVEFPPGIMKGTAVQDEVVWRATYAGALPAADGGTYGVTRNAGGNWVVDFAKTGASARVKLVGRLTGSPENLPEVLVVFLAANVQII